MKELLKYSKELKQYRENSALPQGDVKNALADIYEANYKEKWGVRKINRGCPSCVSDMMKCLCYEFEQMQVEFKGVPIESLNKVDEPTNKLEYARSLKWAQLRKYATSLGINTKGKNREQILDEIDELDG